MKTRLGLLAVSLAVVAGCASHDDGSTPAEAQDSTSVDDSSPPSTQEQAAGADYVARTQQDGALPDDDDTNAPAPDVTTPAEDSKQWLEPDLQPYLDDDGQPIDPNDLTEAETCHRATGYRSGKAFTICITWIDGKAVEVNTARAYLKMRAAAKKRGVYLHVVSGFRTMAQQRYLYHLYVIGRGNLAAPPGYSNHQSGHALDLNTSAPGVYAWLHNHAAAYRFARTVPSEAWHWEHW